jgi:SAM-dependent methyltransferase
MESESVRRFGRVFDGVAEAYDAVRPGYPPELVDAAVERGALGAGSRVLEVGCGTGKLTELLVGRGLVIDAVDPGPNMIAAARKRIGAADAVTFHVGRFEDVRLPEEAFRALFSATAFHWVDPRIGWTKAASHLARGGLLALLAYTGLRDEGSARYEEEFAAVLSKHAPDVAEEWRPLRDLDAIQAGVGERLGNASEVWDWLMSDGRHALAVDAAAELFGEVEVQTALRNVEETADELVAHLRTTSLYFRIDPARREAFDEDTRRVVEQLGGTVSSAFATVLMTARRI